MPQWLSKVIRRVHRLAHRRAVLMTLKAQRELAMLDLGLDADDACDLLLRLRASEFVQRVVANGTGETLYVFKPRLAGVELYLKLALRQSCVIISLHEDEHEES